MSKALTLLAIVTALSISSIGTAEARLFEPQQNWWSSGRTCAATRGPAARRWRALPPRSCAQSPVSATAEQRQPARPYAAHALTSSQKFKPTGPSAIV